MKLHRLIIIVLIIACMLQDSSFAFADEKYPSDQTAEENPYVLQPSVPPQPETWLPRLRVGDEKSYAELHGWINKALLIHDDGDSTLGYFPVDNDAGGTRAGIRLRTKPNSKLTLGINIEGEWEPNSTVTVDQRDNRSMNADINKKTVGWRKGEIGIRHDDYGRLLIGQGPAAADNSAQIDFSGTISAGYSAVGATSGGPFLRQKDGELSTIRWRNAAPNFDGFCCIARVRYDTPYIQNFSLSASVGEDIYPERTHVTVTDFALRYKREYENSKSAAALGYSEPENSSDYTISGSFSTINKQTGISLTFASGYSKISGRNATYIYFKPGIQKSYFDLGTTAFSIDGYYGKDIVNDNSESYAAGLQIVQNVDYYKSEIYSGLRWFDYDDDAADYKQALAWITGARIKF